MQKLVFDGENAPNNIVIFFAQTLAYSIKMTTAEFLLK